MLLSSALKYALNELKLTEIFSVTKFRLNLVSQKTFAEKLPDQLLITPALP